MKLAKDFLLEMASVFRVIVLKWKNVKKRSAGGDKMYTFLFHAAKGRGKRIVHELKTENNKSYHSIKLYLYGTTKWPKQKQFCPFPITWEKREMF